MPDSKPKTITAVLEKMNLDEEAVKTIEEQLTKARGIVLGVANEDNVTAYIYMHQSGVIDLVISLIDEFPEVAAAVAKYFDDAVSEDDTKPTPYIA